MYNAIPYICRVNSERAESVPSYHVRCRSEPVHGSGSVITCDNWFSSVEIFKKMFESYNLRTVGILRIN